MGGGRESVEEVAVWDPLHRDSEALSVSRQEFERAWSGDLVQLTLPSPSTPPSSPLAPVAATEQARDPGKQQPFGSGRRLLSPMLVCLLAVVVLAPVSIGVFLFRTPSEHSIPANASVSGNSERMNAAAIPEARTAGRASDEHEASAAAAADAALPILQPGDTSAAASTLSDGHAAGEANRIAAMPPEPARAGQGRTLEPPPAAPTPMIPPAPGEAKSETDPNASTAAPIIPPADATLTAAEISTLLTLGDKSFSSGDVASARLYYGRAVNAGDGEAALRLGETFDPVFLEHAHLRSARGDLTTALSWYRKARDLGIGEAEVLLNSLEAK